MKILTWEEVKSLHKTVAGISTKHDLVHSLLCNTSSDQLYPNKIIDDEIFYFVGPKTNSIGIKALFNSAEAKNFFVVFEKLGVNKWRDLGTYKIKSVQKEKEDYVSFRLIKADS